MKPFLFMGPLPEQVQSVSILGTLCLSARTLRYLEINIISIIFIDGNKTDFNFHTFSEQRAAPQKG